jgi:hypothetical protein
VRETFVNVFAQPYDWYVSPKSTTKMTGELGSARSTIALAAASAVRVDWSIH